MAGRKITIEILSEHTGGEADCGHKAVCEVCGEEYGETDPTNHGSGWTHVDAVEPTTGSEGNIEYWYCGDCDRYYGDEAGETEITLEDTVLEKLPEPEEPIEPEEPEEPAKKPEKDKVPHIGDGNAPALWLAVFAVCAVGALVCGKKRRYFEK